MPVTAAGQVTPAPSGVVETPVNLPAPQNNLLACQAILNTLYAARQTIATGGLSSIMIDGEQTVFHSSVQLEASIQLWERKVAILNGTRRRIRHIRFCG